MAPQSDYGNIAVAEFQQVGRAPRRARRDDRALRARTAGGAAREIAGVGNQIDALFIPEQADGMAGVSAALTGAGVKTQILGTGIWNDPRVMKLPALQGRVVRRPRGRRLQRLRRALSRQIQRRPDASGDAVL